MKELQITNNTKINMLITKTNKELQMRINNIIIIKQYLKNNTKVAVKNTERILLSLVQVQ